MNLAYLSRIVFVAVWFAAGTAASAQTFETLTTFNETNGAVPTAVLVQGTDGNFYGTTQYGGSADNGTVFRITSTGTLTTLYSFCSQANCVDGSLPTAGLVQGSDGNFYGTTFGGGTRTKGTVFRITPSGALTTLYNFCSLTKCTDGESPHAGLIEGSDGNFYGTTVGGYLYAGNVFKITPTGTLTTLYTFCSLANCADGSSPEGGVIQGSDGNFYGTTSAAGAFGKGGTVFQLTPAGVLTTLYSFCSLANCADGEYPYASLVQGKDGNFYGTTSGSSPDTYGTVFTITPSGSLTTLYNFCSLANCADGEYPYAGVVQGRDGNFYGATQEGGANSNNTVCTLGCGTLFRLTATGSLTTLYNLCSSLNCTDGAEPFAGLVQAKNGTFYGTTSYGGSCSTRSEGCGTVYAWSANVALAPTFTPTSVSFGNEAVDTTSNPRAVTIQNVNTGSATLDLNGITLSGSSDFSLSNGCGSSLNAGKKCNITVTYAPTVLGAESATLKVADNAPGTPQTVSISGTGVAQATLTPTSLTFPQTKVGATSAAKNVILRNNLPTTLSGISYKTSAPFAISSSTCGTTLASNATCTLSVTFTPTATGTATGTLTLKDSANDSPQTVSLTGTGS